MHWFTTPCGSLSRWTFLHRHWRRGRTLFFYLACFSRRSTTPSYFRTLGLNNRYRACCRNLYLACLFRRSTTPSFGTLRLNHRSCCCGRLFYLTCFFRRSTTLGRTWRGSSFYLACISRP
uniref:Uncharacterized protein n=1 Tax=Cacopsylla melanoneura TaxID=428564 RepID=A0A8D8YT65_9HEMI